MVVGSLSVYDPETSWESYSEVLEQYFEANDVPADKQRAILLASIGPKGSIKEDMRAFPAQGDDVRPAVPGNAGTQKSKAQHHRVTIQIQLEKAAAR